MIEKILEFMKKAGKLQMDIRKEKGLCVGYKDHYLMPEVGVNDPVSMVTEADLAVSELFRKFVEDNFFGLDYCIIDEENFAKYGDVIFDKIKNTEYLFVIDPLDGTLHYSQNIPFYGISVGVFKNQEPYVGAIYMPVLEELVFCNENKQAYWRKKVFTNEEHEILLQKNYVTTSKLIVDLQQHFELNNVKNTKGYLFVDYLCSALSYLLIATGRVRSGMFKDWLWDMAGAWCIFDALGYRQYDFTDKKYLTKLDVADLTQDLKFKNARVVGSQDEVEYLCNVIVRDKHK